MVANIPADSATPVAMPQAAFGTPDWTLIAVAFGAAIGVVISLFWLIRQKSGRLAIPKPALALISIFIGFIVGVLCAYFSKHDLVVDIIAGLTTTIFTIQIGEMHANSSMSGKILSLERALDSSATYDRMNSILNSLETIKQLKSQSSEAAPFFEEALSNCFTKLNRSLTRVAIGEISIDDTSRELTTNKDFLLKLPRKEVCAVSYQDEMFWDAPEGADFLKAHREVILHGRAIHRIFMLNKDGASSQRETIRKQMEVGVKCYIVLEESILPHYHEDFVLYDNKYVRFARLSSESQVAPLYKIATLTMESSRVTEYVEKWNYLRSKSQIADEFYGATQVEPRH
jgi:hypothetical protein